MGKATGFLEYERKTARVERQIKSMAPVAEDSKNRLRPGREAAKAIDRSLMGYTNL